MIAVAAVGALALKSFAFLRAWDEDGGYFLAMAVGPLAVSVGSSMAQTQPSWVGVILVSLLSGTEWWAAFSSRLSKSIPVKIQTPPISTLTPSILRPRTYHLPPRGPSTPASAPAPAPATGPRTADKPENSEENGGSSTPFKSPLRAGRSTKRRITLGVTANEATNNNSNNNTIDVDEFMN